MFWSRDKVWPNSRSSSLRSISSTKTKVDKYNDISGEEGVENETQTEEPMTRTEIMLLDYKQFKAARLIQTAFRGWNERKKLSRRIDAAIVIQRWWRGFSVRRNYYHFVEDRLQRDCVKHYHDAATKIQAVFRGWWTRQTVHDMQSLRRMQLIATEDLLNCVAFKLHHLLRTHELPGVYSLRSSNCLYKVEKLLASLNFRFYNGRVIATMAQRRANIEDSFHKFEHSRFCTETPFRGPNFQGICKIQKEETFHNDKDIDKRMFRIIELYEESQRDEHARKLQLKLAERRKRKLKHDWKKLQEKNKLSFCNNVFDSMKRWKVLGLNNARMSRDIFRKPENIESFLNSVATYLEEVETTCHCKMPTTEAIFCH